MKNKMKTIIIFTVVFLLIFFINLANKHTVSGVKEIVVPKTQATENTDSKNDITTKSESYSLSDIAGTYLLDTSKRDFDDSVSKDIINFTITIEEDGNFIAYETPISSIKYMGKYRINNNILSLEFFNEEGSYDDENSFETKSMFKIEDGKLIFIEKDSFNFNFVKLKDGDTFNKI